MENLREAAVCFVFGTLERSSSQGCTAPVFLGVTLEYYLMGQHDLREKFGFSEWLLGLCDLGKTTSFHMPLSGAAYLRHS